MGLRQPINKDIEKEVCIASRRRCCLCVFLEGREEKRQGQIAHLNHDPSDSRLKNLVFLCLEHHDEYDSRPSQSKGFSPQEVRHYRDQLYEKNRRLIATAIPVDTIPVDPIPIVDPESIPGTELAPLSAISQYDIVRRHFAKELEFTSKPWRYGLWQVANRS